MIPVIYRLTFAYHYKFINTEDSYSKCEINAFLQIFTSLPDQIFV